MIKVVPSLFRLNKVRDIDKSSSIKTKEKKKTNHLEKRGNIGYLGSTNREGSAERERSYVSSGQRKRREKGEKGDRRKKLFGVWNKVIRDEVCHVSVAFIRKQSQTKGDVIRQG